MISRHIGYEVPSGHSTLFFETDGGTLENVRFIFGGKQQSLRIIRIRPLCGSEEVVFGGGATLHEATVAFAQLSIFDVIVPFSFHIEIDNLSASTESLQVTALYERDPNQPINPPCGV